MADLFPGNAFRCILAPNEVPGETFRVLKEKEIRVYREYRAKRLALEAWGRF